MYVKPSGPTVVEAVVIDVSHRVRPNVAAFSLHDPGVHTVDDGKGDVKDVVNVEGVCVVGTELGGAVTEGGVELPTLVGGKDVSGDGDGDCGIVGIVSLGMVVESGALGGVGADDKSVGVNGLGGETNEGVDIGLGRDTGGGLADTGGEIGLDVEMEAVSLVDGGRVGGPAGIEVIVSVEEIDD